MAVDFDKYLYSPKIHYISNSGKDEHSGTTGGKAGDQTGHEWALKPWYSRPWSVILRYPDQAVALKIAELGIAAALNDKIGYDQNERTSYWKQLKAANYDPSAIKTACEEDCTAGVSANVKAAGALFGIKKLEDLPICTSRNMRKAFTAAGFIALTAKKYLDGPNYLLPGDILLYESHHGATNITVGSKVREQWKPQPQASAPAVNVQPEPDPAVTVVPLPCVTVTGSSVFVRKGPSTDYGTLGVVHRGDALRYFGFDYPADGWHLVEFEKQTGWISGKYAGVNT